MRGTRQAVHRSMYGVEEERAERGAKDADSRTHASRRAPHPHPRRSVALSVSVVQLAVAVDAVQKAVTSSRVGTGMERARGMPRKLM